MTQDIDTLHLADVLRQKIEAKAAVVGIIGLGYVGLPLARAFRQQGFPVRGFDIDEQKARILNAGGSYIRHITPDDISRMNAGGGFVASSDYSLISTVDVIIICVPTPLSRHYEPDLSYIVSTTEAVTPFLRQGQLVCLESTTYPGTTREVMRPILERSGLVAGKDFYIAFSPEREDPGNPQFNTSTIPKIVGADDPVSRELALAVYEKITRVISVSSADTAEAVKLTENIFRSVNIALVNELKLIYEKMGIDVWEVIDAAKTKPFGFMAFYPGPGLGGHCIPIDPFYLTWKAREFDIATRFIELAGQVNTAMPEHIVRRVGDVLDQHSGRGLNGADILLLGVAYKKNIDDTRESPALKIMDLLRARGARVSYYDP